MNHVRFFRLYLKGKNKISLTSCNNTKLVLTIGVFHHIFRKFFVLGKWALLGYNIFFIDKAHDRYVLVYETVQNLQACNRLRVLRQLQKPSINLVMFLPVQCFVQTNQTVRCRINSREKLYRTRIRPLNNYLWNISSHMKFEHDKNHNLK